MEVLRLRQVLQRTGLGKTSLYERIRTGQFPRSFQLGKNARAVGWLAEAVDSWITEQAQRGGPVGGVS
jgi:prophage regulatory protein